MEIQKAFSPNFLIQELILADLRHSQLIFGLEALGLAPLDNHFLGLGKLIANLIGFSTDQELDIFFEIYQSFMSKSTAFPVTQNGTGLKPLAIKCYEALNRKAQKLGTPLISEEEFLRMAGE